MGTTSNSLVMGASAIDEDNVEDSYINMSSVFEIPNARTGLTTGAFYSYVPYLQGMPASGAGNFTTYDSGLKIAKLR